MFLKEGYIVIADNGVGMDVKALQEFSTYSLDQESRSQAPVGNDTTFISKFGVGGKEAGFYLGDRIRVITRREELAGSDVLDLVLDEEIFKQRQLRGEEVFKSSIFRHHPNDIDRTICSLEEQDIVKRASRIFGGPHYTSMIIRLRDSIRQKFINSSTDTLAAELGEIYRFQLKPELLPNTVIMQEQFRKERTINSEKIPLPRKIGPEHPRIAAPLVIRLDTHSISKEEAFSIDVGDVLQNHLIGAAAAYRFNVAIPDPSPRSTASAAPAELLTQAVFNSNQERLVMEGLLFYYPYVNGSETRPKPVLNEDYGTPIPSQQSISSQSYHQDEEIIDSSDTTFTVYWQNRLLPQSVVQSLPFFPTSTAVAECASFGLPTKWRGRIKGNPYYTLH